MSEKTYNELITTLHQTLQQLASIHGCAIHRMQADWTDTSTLGAPETHPTLTHINIDVEQYRRKV